MKRFRESNPAPVLPSLASHDTLAPVLLSAFQEYLPAVEGQTWNVRLVKTIRQGFLQISPTFLQNFLEGKAEKTSKNSGKL
ncbi:MAG: hypothetical protein PUD66_02160 [Oscillospiraceae bacterium]|nr:hypothetical protein [Oscillospiraceae bacterium]